MIYGVKPAFNIVTGQYHLPLPLVPPFKTPSFHGERGGGREGGSTVQKRERVGGRET
jgi:hypothetical protein